jgi:hypothetical protein
MYQQLVCGQIARLTAVEDGTARPERRNHTGMDKI